uniref:Candidate secreted effector n=1 Tax=Meloidogyne incognita TaxID=6306 RepID=A0A914KVR7_MELIC
MTTRCTSYTTRYTRFTYIRHIFFTYSRATIICSITPLTLNFATCTFRINTFITKTTHSAVIITRIPLMNTTSIETFILILSIWVQPDLPRADLPRPTCRDRLAAGRLVARPTCRRPTCRQAF